MLHAILCHNSEQTVGAWSMNEEGAEVVSPLQVMLWGDRYGQLRDRFGVNWSMGEPA